MNSIDTSRFGRVDYKDEDVLLFPKGIPGFEDRRNWVITGEADDDIKWLQSIEDGGLALAVSHPRSIDPDYNVSVSRQDLNLIETDSLELVGILVVLTIPSDAPWNARANMRAPILVNSDKRLGRQVIVSEDSYPMQAYVFNEKVREELKKRCLTETEEAK